MTEIQWHDRLEPALAQSRESGKPLLVFIWTPE